MIFRPMRPRFNLTTSQPPPDVLRRVQQALARAELPVIGRFAGNYFELMIDPSQRHYWSPRLELDVEPRRDGGSSIHALLGPHPNVWTLFAFVYGTMLCIAAALGLLGIGQYLAGESAWGLLGLPMVFVVVAVMYAVSRVGQKLAGDQAHQLQDFLLAALIGAEVPGSP